MIDDGGIADENGLSGRGRRMIGSSWGWVVARRWGWCVDGGDGWCDGSAVCLRACVCGD